MSEGSEELNRLLAQSYLKGSVDMLDSLVAGMNMLQVDESITRDVLDFIVSLSETTFAMKNMLVENFRKEGIELDG